MLRLFALLATCVFTANTVPPGAITVSAAVSLTEVMQELGRTYETQAGTAVRLNFAASNVLARQIVNGAPVDLFISADEHQMAMVENAGRVLPDTRVSLVTNQLAIIVRADRSDPPLSASALAGPGIRRVAIGNPDAVPAGVYAKQYLERTNLWNALRDKLLPAGSVRAVLAAVANGAADAGIVYVTDASAAASVRVAAIVSGPDAPRVVYPAAVIATSPNTVAARSFLRFLQTPPAAQVFAKHGFQPAGSRPEGDEETKKL